MSWTRRGALALGVARIAYAAALATFPARTAAPWLGPDAGTAAGRVAVRGLGARDGVISIGITAAAIRDRPLRPWLLAGAVGDATDLLATLADADGLADNAARATIAVAGGTAAAGVALAIASR